MQVLRQIGGVLCSVALATISASSARAWTQGDDFDDRHCRTERDQGGDTVDVCRAIYGRDKVYLGVYWEDGSSVVGPCSTSDPEPIEYKGMSQRDAQSWVDSYCR